MFTKDKSFLGAGWSFPPEFTKPDHGVAIVSLEADIDQSLLILFGTSLRERVLQPDYGCNLNDYLMASMNVSLISYLEDLLRRAVLLHEPRIDLLGLRVKALQLEGILEIKMTYIVRATNSRRNQVYPFYLKEATDIANP